MPYVGINAVRICLIHVQAIYRTRHSRLALVFILSLPDIVGKGVMFSGCPSSAFVHSSGQIVLPRYLVNGLNSLGETSETSLY